MINTNKQDIINRIAIIESLLCNLCLELQQQPNEQQEDKETKLGQLKIGDRVLIGRVS